MDLCAEEHHEDCEPGEFMLSDQELQWLVSALNARSTECAEFAGCTVSRAADPQEPETRTRMPVQMRHTDGPQRHAEDEQAGEWVAADSSRSLRSAPDTIIVDSDTESAPTPVRRRITGKRPPQHIIISPRKRARADTPRFSSSASSRSPQSEAPSSRLRGALLDHESSELLVHEVLSASDADAAVSIHLGKDTFSLEREAVIRRVHVGEQWRCRTWVLRGPLQSENKERPYLAAMTCRINPYSRKAGCWAQVLNMSAGRERQGYGTVLVAGVEEILAREGADIICLYPAQNGRAPGFWASLGYFRLQKSMLPQEELKRKGPLWPERDPHRGALPRWERRIAPAATKKTACRASWSAPIRRESALSGDPLMACTNAVQQRRKIYKRTLQQTVVSEGAVIG